MKQFQYTIQDKNGIHARPAGLLVKTASTFASDLQVEKDGRSVSAKKLFALMSLNVKQGDMITLKAEGADEELAAATLETFFKDNF